MDQWRAFVRGSAPAEGVRDEVIASWRRSRDAGVDPDQAAPPQVTTEELEKRRQASARLIQMMGPSLDGIAKHLASSALVACLADPGGCVLNAWGGAESEDAEVARLTRPGTLIREAALGTTAASLAEASGRGAVCAGAEHFSRCLHALVDAALPVRGETAERQGYLILVGRAGQSSAAPMLALGRSIVRLASVERASSRWRGYAERLSQTMAGLMSTASSPVLLVGPRGYARAISPAAARMLQLDTWSEMNRPIDQMARFEPPLLPMILGGKEASGVPVEVHTSARSFRALVTVTPLRDAAGGFLGAMLTLLEPTPLPRRRRESQGARFTFQDIVGESPLARRCKEMARIAASASVSVLLEGPSGTGKELFAQAIHNESDRRDGPFVSVNCAAIPAELIESELFGYEEGAFTGARRGGMVGKFEAASGGTIFLDEVGDMPLAVQAECLRVLENRTIVRVGQHEEIPVDIRVIAATNKRLADEVEAGRFREDLYYRLGVFRISLPALRESATDVPLLAAGFVDRFNNEMSRSVQGFAPGVLQKAVAYDWPGNVRELKNAIQHAVMVDTDGLIGMDDLPESLRDEFMRQGSSQDASNQSATDKTGIERLRRELAEGAKELYLAALRETGGNAAKAAKVLGVSRATFYRKMRQMGIVRRGV